MPGTLIDRTSHGARAVSQRSRSLARRIDRRLPGAAAVLAYHRIDRVGIDPWELTVSPQHFAEHLAVLGDAGRVVPLDELLGQSPVARVARARVQFAVTFDDGYVDNLTSAVPALEAADAPATVFIAPGLLGRPSYWWDVLAALVLGSGHTVTDIVSAARSTALLDDDGVAATDVDARVVHDRLHGTLITRPLPAIDDTLGQLAAALGADLPGPGGRPLTTEELVVLAAHPLVSIGVHTMTHPRLPGLPPAEARREIDDAARRLDDLLGRERRVLVYPYGSTSPEVADLAAELGFEHAVTTESRWLHRRAEDRSAPRLHPRDVGREAFAEWLHRWT